MVNWIPPSIIFIVAALIIPFLSWRAQKVFVLAVPVFAMVNLFLMQEGSHWIFEFLGHDIVLAKVDKLSFLFAFVFIILHFIGMLFANHIKEHWEHSTAFLYAGGTLGVVFAGDFLSLYCAWEFMAGASVCMIWNSMREKSRRAGVRFILIHFFGGLCLLAGFIIHYKNTGSLEFGPILEGGLAYNLILISFLINAAAPPFSAWLSDSYPESTPTGTVFLSGFTTKSAVYVLVRTFAGSDTLLWIGVAMAIYGVIFATLENDMRRLLAYHVISQVGYMVAGIGIGTELAINGVCAHAFCHIIYKSLLFMGAGTILQQTGKSKLSELGGLYKYMKPIFYLYMIGAVSISAFPLFNGFVSKSLIVTAAAERHLFPAWILLTMVSCGTFLSVGLKLPYFAFFGKESGLRPKKSPINMALAMGIGSFLCILFGVYPKLLYNMLPFPVDYKPYTVSHVVGSLQMLMFTGLAFTLLKKAPKTKISLDTDWFYRKGTDLFLWFVENPMFTFIEKTKKLFFESIPDFLTWYSFNPLSALYMIAYIVAMPFIGDEKKKELRDQMSAAEENIFHGNGVRIISIGNSFVLICSLLIIYLLICFIF